MQGVLNLKGAVTLSMALMAYGGAAQADSMECNGEIVSEGDSEQRLLSYCGKPVSRSGDDWRYEIPGSLPVVVTLGDGIIMFIRDADEVPEGAAAILKDRP
jgi:hypothetical protein